MLELMRISGGDGGKSRIESMGSRHRLRAWQVSALTTGAPCGRIDCWEGDIDSRMHVGKSHSTERKVSSWSGGGESTVQNPSEPDLKDKDGNMIHSSRRYFALSSMYKATVIYTSDINHLSASRLCNILGQSLVGESFKCGLDDIHLVS